MSIRIHAVLMTLVFILGMFVSFASLPFILWFGEEVWPCQSGSMLS